MTYDKLLDGMRLIYALLVPVVAGCSSTAAKPTHEDTLPVITSQPTTVSLEHPILTFDVIPIPRECVTDKVSGDVEVLERQRGWVPLTNNVRLTDGSKLRIGAGASFTIRFSPAERVEFSPAEAERWVVLDIQSGQ
ncbi:hypothetical protein [Steroidobacter cummioxidans]|uniref:hypothetical protein n=1 Tax=Steroidobacter cummioxidans TaxID=1803913 RepID=UPI000E30FEFC|nr:hypothetical protein [Steroidobacter cummioxidans]